MGIDPQGGPIFMQIVQAVERALVLQTLLPGDKLPSSRDLAMHIRVNPNTVAKAYSELEQLAYAETKRGLGTFIREDVVIEAMRTQLFDAAVNQFLDHLKSINVSVEYAVEVLKRHGHQ